MPIVAAVVLASAIMVPVLAVSDAPAASKPKKTRKFKRPQAGNYSSKGGSLTFTVRGRRILKFSALVEIPCRRGSDNSLTEIGIVGTFPSERPPSAKLILKKRKGRWVFQGKWQDADEITWTVSGRFVSRTKAKGKIGASTPVKPTYNFSLPDGNDTESCSGRGPWAASHVKRQKS